MFRASYRVKLQELGNGTNPLRELGQLENLQDVGMHLT
jgi:hypothetical protein